MRILVAENDGPLADFLCQKLEAEQFSVELIPGTQEAQKIVAERPCDLALLDLALPTTRELTRCGISGQKSRNCRWFFDLAGKCGPTRALS